MGKGKKAILIGLVLMVVLYVAESLYIRSKVYLFVRASYASYVESEAYESIVPDEIFKKMCYRKGYPISSKDVSGAKETNKLSFPFTYHYFICGSSTYKYSYSIYDESGNIAGGSWGIPVTVSVCLQNGRWVITDYYEAP